MHYTHPASQLNEVFTAEPVPAYRKRRTSGRKEGESKNLMNTEDKRVNTRRNESKEAPERKRLLERSAFQWAMSLLTSAFGTALTLYLIHRL